MHKKHESLLLSSNEQNIVEEDLLLIGYRTVNYRLALYYVAAVITCGLSLLFFKWLPKWKLRFISQPCELSIAHTVVVFHPTEGEDICPVKLLEISLLCHIRFFEYRCLRYCWSNEDQIFARAKFDINKPYAEIYELYAKIDAGLSEETAAVRLQKFGKNLIDVPVHSYWYLAINEVLHPFYLFQIFSVVLWLFDGYTVYALCIFVMSTSAAAINVYQTRKNMASLCEMARLVCPVNLLREGNFISGRSSEELVPGDIIEIESGMTLPCDLLILQGQCVVNESMLTGESLPVVKTSLPAYEEGNGNFHPDSDAKYVLFSGTNVLQVRPVRGQKVLALVFCTGFGTAKGMLVRSILHPKPTKFTFYEDSFKFLGVLAGLAMLGFIYSVFQFVRFGADVAHIFVRGAVLITIIVPPGLPVAMTIGTGFAMARLKASKVYCIAPSRVNVSGRVNLFCFDKTGTLTVDGLDVLGAIPVRESRFLPLAEDLTRVPSEILSYIFASCHSITVLEDHNFIGDILEVRMFEATGWKFEENNDADYYPGITTLVHNKEDTIGIIKRFEFSSQLQRMSTVVYHIPTKRYFAFVKGSPEMIRSLSVPSSVPNDFETVLSEQTNQGYRVIACAYLDLPDFSVEKAQQLSRQAVENQLTFAGFLVLQNKLKEDTAEVIDLLMSADVKCVMITGDNPLTAINVARKANIIPRGQTVYLCDVAEQEHSEENSLNSAEESVVMMENDENPPIVDLLTGEEEEEQDWNNHQFQTTTVVNDSRNNTHSGADHPSPTLKDRTPHLVYKYVPPLPEDEEHHNKMGHSTITIHHNNEDNNNHDMNIMTSRVNGIPEWIDRDDIHMAMTGAAYQYLENIHSKNKDTVGESDHELDLMERLVQKGVIYARMSPFQKASLVELFQELPIKDFHHPTNTIGGGNNWNRKSKKHCNTVGMCGDGANDCSALKAADVGMSLSEAEASVAAPFTSKIPSIRSVHLLLREGRCALATSMQMFKYMACYSMIQFLSVLILYSIGSVFGDWQFLWIDLILVIPLVFLMGRTGPTDRLSKMKPNAQLVSVPVLSSVIGQTIIMLAFQIVAFVMVTTRDWYVPLPQTTGGDYDPKGSISNMGTTTIFIFSNFQYLVIFLAFSINKPFRNPIYTNKSLVLSLVAMVLLCIWLVITPPSWLMKLLEMAQLPFSFLMWLLLFALVNAVFVWVYERFVIVYLLRRFNH